MKIIESCRWSLTESEVCPQCFLSRSLFTSSLYFHKARALRHTSALSRNNARSLRHENQRAQSMIHFIPRTLLNYISTWNFLRTPEKCTSLVFLKMSCVLFKLNNALGAFFISLIVVCAMTYAER